jgi:aminoglycoside phosphotransferase (APT) family kinase protein
VRQQDTSAARQHLLARFGLDLGAEIGRGGEACVYALDGQRVLRVSHSPAPQRAQAQHRAFLMELGQSAGRVPFSIPEVLDQLEIDGQVVSIERRLPGRALVDVLGELSGPARRQLIIKHLDAAACIGDLQIERPYFGDINHPAPIRTSTFAEYLKRRAEESLRVAADDLREVDAAELASGWPEPDSKALVHLDAFAGNMLSDGETITAVIDFGVVSVVGDRRLDPLLAAAYLVPPICRTARPEDQVVCGEWQEAHGLAALYRPARRWAAAYWSFARDDAALAGWCQAALKGP